MKILMTIVKIESIFSKNCFETFYACISFISFSAITLMFILYLLSKLISNENVYKDAFNVLCTMLNFFHNSIRQLLSDNTVHIILVKKEKEMAYYNPIPLQKKM